MRSPSTHKRTQEGLLAVVDRRVLGRFKRRRLNPEQTRCCGSFGREEQRCHLDTGARLNDERMWTHPCKSCPVSYIKSNKHAAASAQRKLAHALAPVPAARWSASPTLFSRAAPKKPFTPVLLCGLATAGIPINARTAWEQPRP